MIMPDEYAKLRDNLQMTILNWCKEAGVDSSDPDQIHACAKPIWIALEESGHLHPQMTYPAFVQNIEQAAFAKKMSTHFESVFIRVNL